MKFAPRELCEKLEKLGCKSENDFVYVCGKKLKNKVVIDAWILFLKDSAIYMDRKITAFSQNDFTGCHKKARENAKLVWGNDNVCKECGSEFQYDYEKGKACSRCGDKRVFRFEFYRYKMIDSEDWIKFIEDSLK